MQERGFSLVELLIVVAIILIICAIAIPSLLHSRISANEASAVYSVRTINTAQVTYNSTYPTIGYASTLNQLASPTSGQVSSTNAGILDSVLGCTTASCTKNGYSFIITNITTSNPVTGYSAWATPTFVGITGYRSFCSDNLNPILYDPNGANPPTCTIPMQ